MYFSSKKIVFSLLAIAVVAPIFYLIFGRSASIQKPLVPCGKIFIIHYTPLVERKVFALDQLQKHGLEAEFVEQYDREVLSEFDKKLFDLSEVSLPEASCMMKHILCYRQVKDGYEHALILEDDAILCDNFNQKLMSYMAQLPEDWDMCFIGNGCNLHIPRTRTLLSNTNIYPKENYETSWGGDGASRCIDSYLISKKCAEKILAQVDQENCIIDKSPDWWLNDVIRSNHFNVYWAEPTIVIQGSELGKFQSSLR